MNARVQAPTPGAAEPVVLPINEAAKPAAAAVATPPVPTKKKGGGRRLLLMASVPVLLAAVGGYFWLTGGRHIDTDNAYVQQPKISISSDVAGRIVSVAVTDNQW